MPIYEYRCQKCRRRFSVLWRSYAAINESQVKCRYCQNDQVTRLVSRVRVLRSEDSRMEDLADPSAWGDFDENDPKSMGRFMRKMVSEMGDEAGDLGPEFDEVIDRLESGQDPDQIEKEVPDLMGDAGDAGGLGGDMGFDM